MTNVYESTTWSTLSALADDNTTRSSEDSSVYIDHQYREEIMKFIYIAVSVFGIPGNLLALLAISTSPRMRKKPFNLLLVNQSVIDLCYWICGVIQVIQPEFPSDRNGIRACKLWSLAYIYWGLLTNSNYNLVTIAIERLMATYNPLKYDEERVLHRMPYVVVLIWLSGGFIVFLPSLFTSYPMSSTECMSYHKKSYAENLVVLIWYSTCIVIIPLVTIVHCYGRIIYYLYQQSKSEPVASGTGRVSLHKAQIHIMQMTITISLIFIVVYIYNTITMYGFVFYHVPSYPYYDIGVCLIMVNSAINPYVYCIRYDDFQQRILEIFRNTKTICCLFCKTNGVLM